MNFSIHFELLGYFARNRHPDGRLFAQSVTDFNDIDQGTKDKIKTEGSDRVESSMVNRYSGIVKHLDLFRIGENMLDDTTFDAPELTNIYFNVLKQGSSGNWKNAVFYVYKVTAHYAQEPEPRTAYAAVYYKNAVKKADGSIDLDLTVDKYDTNIYATGATLEDVYTAVVTANKALFEIQEITP